MVARNGHQVCVVLAATLAENYAFSLQKAAQFAQGGIPSQEEPQSTFLAET